MAQDPLQIDAIRVEPSLAGTRTLTADPTTGGLLFTDPVASTGILLKALAGLNLDNFLVVGQGDFAQYSAIQDAIDAIPLTASDSDPWAIFVGPGVWIEDLVLERNGVIIIGFGAILQEDVALDTLTIQAGGGTVPEFCILQDLIVTNTRNGGACVRVIGAAASTVGQVGISLENCGLIASGVGGYPIRANSVNIINVNGGDWGESSQTSLTLIEEVAAFKVNGVQEITGLQLDYDTTGALPIVGGSEYEIVGSNSIAKTSTLTPPVSSTLSGAGSLTIANCPSVAETRVFGDRTFLGLGNQFGNLQIQGTTAARLVGSTRGTVLGTGTLDEPILQGVVAFIANSSRTITFAVPQSDATYKVQPELPSAPVGAAWPTIVSKTGAGFIIEFRDAAAVPVIQSMTVGWTATREM